LFFSFLGIIFAQKNTMEQDKSIIQSRLLTQARYNFDVHEKRIVYKLMEIAQAELKGQKLNDKIYIEKSLYNDRRIYLALSELVPDGMEGTKTAIKKAFKKLLEKVIEINYPNGSWAMYHYVHTAKYNEKYGKYEIGITADIWQAFMDFTKGYSVYFLNTAMSFSSVYAMRLYELLANNTKPISYELDWLRDRFLMGEKKYKETKDFIKWVIDGPLQEINEKSEIYVSYSVIKTGKKITGVTFFVTPKEPKSPIKEIVSVSYKNNRSARVLININVIDCLKGWFYFTEREILANAALIYEAQKKCGIDALVDKLSKTKAYSQTARKPQAYLINTLKTYLQE
jgi:plasmid replication initiation protein